MLWQISGLSILSLARWIGKVYIERQDERVISMENLSASIEQQDNIIDKLWTKEAEEKIDAFEEGKIEAVLFDEIFNKCK